MLFAGRATPLRPLMGWTACFPRGAVLDCSASTGEAAHGHHHCAPLASIGIDIGKEVFHLVGFGTDGKIAFRRKIKRLALIETFRKLPTCIVSMEACLSAHFASRSLRKLGHEPRIIPAIYVKPFVKGQKNDYNDAEAIAEARGPNLRTVREKSQEHLDLQPIIVVIAGADEIDPYKD